MTMWLSSTVERGDRGRPSAGRARRTAIGLAAAVLLAAAAPGLASDPPHWLGAVETMDCTSNCHTLHHAQGGQLTSAAGNVNLCQSCHSSGALPITNADKARPGIGGRSHGFDVAAVNAEYGTQLPSIQAMALRVMAGNVVCSTCHNQHAADAAKGGTPRISAASKAVDLLGGGAVTSGGEFSGAAGVWYLLDVTAQGSAATARFRYSKDNGSSWMPSGCTPLALTTCLTASTSPVALDSGVEVTFAGAAGDSFRLGERWEFYASYPFLRVALDEGDAASVEKFCRDCHADWSMSHSEVESWDGGYKSHPVGVSLSSTGKTYDRAQPLDGNGVAQAGLASPDVDGNATNDIKLDATGKVQCLSCHGVHYADSNTLTVDAP